jgi:serine protease
MNNKLSRAVARWVPGLVCALALSSAWAPSLSAERGPQRASPLKQSSTHGRVIVTFKTPLQVDGARTIQSAGHKAVRTAAVIEAERTALQSRALGLGQRRGLALRGGHGIDERTQAVEADGLSSEQLAARLRADPEVESAVVDGRRRIALLPDDPLYAPAPTPANGPAAGQWYLKPPQADKLTSGSEILSAIDAQNAWDFTTGSSSVVVAVIDTGVRYDHPDLQGKLLQGFDMISDTTLANDGDGRDADASDPGDWISQADKSNPTFADCDVQDSSWHGTQVAGLIGAATNNGVGMAGVGWGVKILPVRVLGKCFGNDSDIIAGMRWAAGLSVPGVPDNPNPAKVLNMSLGSTDTTVRACSSTNYPAAISEITGAGVTIVVAAGNGTGHAVQPPGNCGGVITVGGVRQIGTKVGYSDLGTEVSLSAPAGNCVNLTGTCLFPLLTTTNAGTTTPGTNTYSDGLNPSLGTSFATPLVAGTAALMLSANPNLTPAEVRTILRNTARVFPFRGAPADDSGAIQQCTAPTSSDQLQCYCTATTCGAGMLDALWSVYSAKNDAPLPAITVSGGSAVKQTLVTLTTAGSSVAGGRTISSQQWTLIDGGGIVSGFTGGGSTSPAATVTMTPSAAGQFSVRLTQTDSAGIQGVHEQTIQVLASAPPPPSTGGGGGGGAWSWPWSAGLVLAVLALMRRRAR